VQEFHRQLFNSSADALRGEIKRITGVNVRELATEIEPTTGTVVKAFTTGTVVQVYLLAENVPTEVWSGKGSPTEYTITHEVSVPDNLDGNPSSGGDGMLN
jgi:hypothetical protein